MPERFFVGTRKGLFTIERKRGEWSVTDAALLGDPVSMLLPEADGTLHVAQELGHFGVKLKRTRDGGATWEDREVPKYPPKPEDVEDLDPVRNEPLPWDLKSVWALERGSPDRPGEIWCGTIPGGLFRSDDGGDSWTLVESLWNHPDRSGWFGGGADYPGIHSILVDPRDANKVRIGVSCGGLWLTEDGGESWDVGGVGMRAAFMPPDQAMNPKVQDPHCVVQCRASPDHLWIQHHNGIFRSTDAGRTCTEIVCENPSSFGFATAVHPEDPGRAWFVPGVKDEKRYPVDGKLVVTRTQDGGETFDVLDDGLPGSHAYDLVYRHGLAIDETGDVLAFGSTPGNVWVSDNQGQSWQRVSSFLPPVYCVRFAV